MYHWMCVVSLGGLLIIFSLVTLHDIVHTDKSLTLVFEYLERDLKQYMDDCGAILAMNNVKLFLYQVILNHCRAQCNTLLSTVQ